MDRTLNITKIHIIRFAGVTEQVFSFKDGVNIIFGENRSGKSTLCEFIRFMYYGFEGREAEDFYPFNADSPSVCGSMTVNFAGRAIEIFREKSFASDILEMTDKQTGAPYRPEGFTSPGEHFLGMSSGIYDRSLYCPQDMASLVSSGELLRCETELIRAYSGEEDFSSLALSLVQQKNEITNPEKTGTLDIMLAQRENLDAELVSAIIKQNEIMNIASVISETSEKLLDAEKKIVIAKADIENLHNLKVEEESRRLKEAEEELERKRINAETLAKSATTAENLAEVEQDYQELCDMGEKLEIMEVKLANTKSNLDMHNDMIDTERYSEDTLREVSEKAEKRTKLAHSLLILSLPMFALSAVVFGGLMLLAKSLSVGQIFLISSAFLALSLISLGASLAVSFSKNMLYKSVGAQSAEDFEDSYDLARSLSQTSALYLSTYRDEARHYNEMAQKYSKLMENVALKLGASPDTANADSLGESLKNLREATEAALSAQKEYEKFKAEFDDNNSALLKKKNEEYSALLHNREKELGWFTNQREALFEKKSSLEEIFSTAVIHTERPAYIKTRLNETEREIDRLRQDLSALEIACDVLEDAMGVMKFRIKSHLSHGVNKTLNFALHTNESFLIDDSYCLQYKNDSRLIPVFTDSLSRSSRAAKGISRSLCEMAAIALRMTLTELLEAEKSAMVLDEPFAFIDAWGEEKMIKRLENSGMSQVFLFTSHEVPCAEKYNLVKMG